MGLQISGTGIQKLTKRMTLNGGPTKDPPIHTLGRIWVESVSRNQVRM